MEQEAPVTLVASDVGVKEKTGSLLSASVHILTAMIGVGVLAMPKALGTLGWVAGPAAILIFYAVSILAALLLATCFEVNGQQHPKYYEAVAAILGRKAEIAAAICQLSNIFLVCIAFTITSAISMGVIANLVCDEPAPEVESSGEGGCFNQEWKFTIIFGAAQIVMVQFQSMESSWVASASGAIGAVIYCGIALGLSIGKVADGAVYGRVGGISYDTPNKAFECLNALGSIGFAYGFSQIFLEVQDTIREPPKAVITMQKACKIALTLGLLGYMAVSILGYMAFGDAVPDNILTAFDSPKWLVILAQAFVLINMVASYNIFAQTFFLSLESYACRVLGMRHPAEEAALEAAAAALSAASGGSLAAAKTPHLDAFPEEGGEAKEQLQGGQGSMTSQGAHRELSAARAGSLIHAVASFREGSCDLRSGSVRSLAGPLRMSSGLRGRPACKAGGTKPQRSWRGVLLSVALRTMFVLVTTVIAVCVPFFGAITGLIGSLVFWPLAIAFPFAMYKAAYKPSRGKVLALNAISAFMLLVSLAAVVGSVRNIIISWSSFTLFA